MRSGRHVLQTHVRGKQPGCVQKERVRRLNSKALRQGKYVLLWVQQDVRSQWNHALVRSASSTCPLTNAKVAASGLQTHGQRAGQIGLRRSWWPLFLDSSKF